MNADCAFTIGASHQICQDYARTATKDGRVSIWLADGCSSSPDTDWGARLLVQAAIKHEAALMADATPGRLPESFLEAVSKTTSRTVKQLHLAPTCLDATLLGVVAEAESGTFRLVVYGDGVAVLGRSDGTVDVYEVSYTRNYPLYLNYRNDTARAVRWAAEAENEQVITTTRFRTAGGKYERLPGGETTKGASSEPLVLDGDTSDFRFAAVFSDGVTSFTPATASGTMRAQEPCTGLDLLPELLAIKNWTGAFVQRRIQRFVREAQARGLRYQDDLAMAMVYFGD